MPHKPPFDNKAHISGQKLFVSAYHGFATLGNEHIPVLQRFVKFPPFAVCLADAVKLGENLVIPAAVAIPSAWEAGRYRLLAKLLLDVPGKGKHPGHLKNYLADRVCGSGDVLIVVPNYASVFLRHSRSVRRFPHSITSLRRPPRSLPRYPLQDES